MEKNFKSYKTHLQADIQPLRRNGNCWRFAKTVGIYFKVDDPGNYWTCVVTAVHNATDVSI